MEFLTTLAWASPTVWPFGKWASGCTFVLSRSLSLSPLLNVILLFKNKKINIKKKFRKRGTIKMRCSWVGSESADFPSQPGFRNEAAEKMGPQYWRISMRNRVNAICTQCAPFSCLLLPSELFPKPECVWSHPFWLQRAKDTETHCSQVPFWITLLLWAYCRIKEAKCSQFFCLNKSLLQIQSPTCTSLLSPNDSAASTSAPSTQLATLLFPWWWWMATGSNQERLPES